MKPLVVLVVVAAPAFGQLGPLLYQQQPDRLFGYASDTAIVDEFGEPQSAVRADRFSLAAAGAVGQVVWFGIYGPQLGPIQPPPVNESFRVRFYSQNGTFPPTLPPADLLYETIVVNPDRQETGALVSGGFPEYRFIASLPSPFLAASATPYWLSVSQLDDPASYFRWETAGPGEHARQIPADTSWVVVNSGQFAYQLRVPEPVTASLLAIVALAGAMKRSNRLR